MDEGSFLLVLRRWPDYTVNFCSWLFQSKLGFKPLHCEESVIASSVLRRVCNGLIKGCSGSKTEEEASRKEGTLLVSTALPLPEGPLILSIAKLFSTNLLLQFFKSLSHLCNYVDTEGKIGYHLNPISMANLITSKELMKLNEAFASFHPVRQQPWRLTAVTA